MKQSMYRRLKNKKIKNISSVLQILKTGCNVLLTKEGDALMRVDYMLYYFLKRKYFEINKKDEKYK